jgi:hypothetical protein
MRGYIAQLERMTEAANAANTATASKPATPPYTPLTTQLQNLFATMTENQRNRDWTVAELIPRLQGQFRSAPSAAKVAAALKQLGFVQYRDFTRAGGGARTWRRV